MRFAFSVQDISAIRSITTRTRRLENDSGALYSHFESFPTGNCIVAQLRSLETRFPVTAPLLQESTYIDDLLIRAATTKSAIQMPRKILQILHETTRNIRNWASNDPVVAAEFEQGVTSAEKPFARPLEL